MSAGAPRRSRLAGALCGAVAAALACAGGAARGDALTLRFEPRFDYTTSTTTDQGGEKSELEATGYSQRTVVNYENRLFPLLRVLGYGFYESALVVTSLDGSRGETESSRWSVTGQVSAGDPQRNASLAYDRTQRSEDSLAGGIATFGDDLIREAVTLHGSWRPEALPWVNLRLVRSHQFDERRQSNDLDTTEAFGNAAYQARKYELRYRLAWQELDDHITGTDTTTLGNSGRASWGDRALDDRLALFGSYELSHRSTETTVTGAGGTVATQQFPVQGLSAVETFPATPARVALVPNQALVDGDAGPGAGLNIGFGPTLSGDTDARDAGAQFADAITPVNAIYLWVDRPLPPAVTAAFAFSAYRSDNNLDWTAVPISGPVVFGNFQNRFEIPVSETQARYLKVTVKPLGAAVTTDQRYRDVLVTEIQFFRLQPAASSRGRASVLRGNANASARLQILRGGALSYDFTGILTHEGGTGQATRYLYTVANGLSTSLRLGAVTTLSGRLERSDFDSGTGKEAQDRLSATLGVNPLPVLGASLTYNGQVHEAPSGREIGNNVTGFARAEPYRGVALSGNAGYSHLSFAAGRTGQEWTAQAGAALTPNRWVTVTGGYGYTRSEQVGGGKEDVRSHLSRLDTAVTATPFPALFASAGWSRVWSEKPRYDLLNLALNATPLPGGDLYLAFAYSESLDTRLDQRLRSWGPSLRWKIKGPNYLDVGYSVVDQTSQALAIHTRAFTARLTVKLP